MDLGFDVVELPACSPPVIGDAAPDFTRPLVSAASWRDETLSELVTERPVLLLFHPMLGSFPATYIWQTVTDRDWVSAYDIAAVGIVISTPYDCSRFINERDIDGRLFSDPTNGVAERYDVVHDLDGMASIAEPRPAAFVIDEDRSVQYSWAASEWPQFPDYDEIESALASL